MLMRDEIWLTCARKTCCHGPIVVPSGRDVWRIARSLDVPAWTFLRYFLSPEPRPDGFKLDHSDRQFRLALAKQSVRRVKWPPCVFLMRTRGGQHRCSLGELRPRSCQSFPFSLIDGVLVVPNNGGCACRTWSIAEVDVAALTARVEAREAEALEYQAIVTRWNAQVDASGQVRFSLEDYCSFLLAAYDERSRLAARGPL